MEGKLIPGVNLSPPNLLSLHMRIYLANDMEGELMGGVNLSPPGLPLRLLPLLLQLLLIHLHLVLSHNFVLSI